MKDVIQKEEIEKMNRYGKIYTIMLIATAVSAVPLFMLLGVWALIPWCIIWESQCISLLCLKKLKRQMMFKRIKKLLHFLRGNYWMIYKNREK